MLKEAQRYLDVDPWMVTETGFHPEHSEVSESIFSLANEYMGVRGYFEEGYGKGRLVGSYFGGFYEETPVCRPAPYKGLISRARFMVNTVDWLYTRISLDGEILDLAWSNITGFKRVLDFKSGTLKREFIWHTAGGKALKISFHRFVSMTERNLGCQQMVFTALNFSGAIEVQTGLDFSPPHTSAGRNFWTCPMRKMEKGTIAVLGKTVNTGRRLFSGFQIKTAFPAKASVVEREKYIGMEFVVKLNKGAPVCIDKIVTNYTEKDLQTPAAAVWRRGMELAGKNASLSFATALEQHVKYWASVWNRLDIVIEGDPENQQGIRFCIFQLHQTFHGTDPGLNIGAKGLTGEAYNGHTFWDTELYCLPFYIFNNPPAARNLLEFRYRTLKQAKERAEELDCRGAFYPVATIDGTESCGLWQHASLQLQVGLAVAYGIWQYHKICRDDGFLHRQGIEMLVEICRYYAARGQWSPRTGEFGFYGVMGPDEFQLMVNNNCYLNFTAKKTFLYAIKVVREMETRSPELLAELRQKTGLNFDELAEWEKRAAAMRLPQDKKTGLFEQHDGYFDLPHIDVDSIPATDFPLYHNWSYDRIYRYDMIKQPDVLMFLFLYSQEFSEKSKRVNYEYYEPRCVHESSLSPSIHSIIAAELGEHEQAFAFFRFATRLDLDNYNRNTNQGLHITSIAAAWMNIVYGFGGMRTDGDDLVFNPSILKSWRSYCFRVIYRDAVIQLSVGKEFVEARVVEGPPVRVKVYGDAYLLDPSGVKIKIPERYRA